MTNKQKTEARQMRANGATYQYIADSLGVSRQRIHKIINETSSVRNSLKDRGYIYTNLVKYMEEHELSVNRFYKLLGYGNNAGNTFYKKLKGEIDFRINDMEKIHNVTGLTYEQIFYMEESLDD